MSRVFLLIVACLIAVLASACVSAKYAFPTAGELEGSGRFDARQLESLEAGRVLAVVECSDCHRMYWPAEYSAEEWPGILATMGRRASLTEEEIADLELYFTVVAADSFDASREIGAR